MCTDFYVNVSLQLSKINAIAGLYGNCTLGFIRKCQTIFWSGCVNLHSHQQHRSAPVSLHPCQQLAFSPCFILAILIYSGDISLWLKPEFPWEMCRWPSVYPLHSSLSRFFSLYSIGWFLSVESASHGRNKYHVVTMYNFYTCITQFGNVVEDFCIYTHKKYWFVFFLVLFCHLFVQG